VGGGTGDDIERQLSMIEHAVKQKKMVLPWPRFGDQKSEEN